MQVKKETKEDCNMNIMHSCIDGLRDILFGTKTVLCPAKFRANTSDTDDYEDDTENDDDIPFWNK